MTIDEAIRIKKNELDAELVDPHVTIQMIEEADQLGIEALEKVVALRQISGMPLPLPSETDGSKEV